MGGWHGLRSMRRRSPSSSQGRAIMLPSASAAESYAGGLIMVELSSKEPRLGISTAIVTAIAMTAFTSGLGAGITPAFASGDPPVGKTRRALDFLGQAA